MHVKTLFAASMLCGCAAGPDTYSLPPDHPARVDSQPANPAPAASGAAAPSPAALQAFRRLISDTGLPSRSDAAHRASEQTSATQLQHQRRDATLEGGEHERHR